MNYVCILLVLKILFNMMTHWKMLFLRYLIQHVVLFIEYILLVQDMMFWHKTAS